MSFYTRLKSWFDKGAVFFMRTLRRDYFYTVEEMYTPRGWLKLLDELGSYLAFGSFSTIAVSKWRHIPCFNIVALKEQAICLFPAVLPCATVFTAGFVYSLSRRSANKELRIAEKVFPQGRLPEKWMFPTDLTEITLSVGIFFLSYVALAWFSDSILAAAPLMFVIASNDLKTLRLIKTRTEKYFGAREYFPLPEDKDYGLIIARREIIRKYYYSKPQEWKELGRIFGCVLAFSIAWRGRRSTAYIVLMLTLIANEIITAVWRVQRDRALLALQGAGQTRRSQIGKAGTP